MPEKLVRDGILDIIIKETKQVPNYRFATKQQMTGLLWSKLREEFIETAYALEGDNPEKVIDEIADVTQVLLTMGVEATPTSPTVEARRQEKKFDRGGFDEGIVINFPKS